LSTPVQNKTIKITTFSVHDNLFIRTERFVGTATKRYTLSKTILNDNYVWVYIDGVPITARYDYEIMDDLRTIQLSEWIETYPNNEVTIMYINPPTNGETVLGFRIFNDIFNRTHYKRLADFYSTTLSRELMADDTEIYVADASRLVPPNPAQNKPGIIIVDAERIEFLAKEGNVLKQLRRSTLGTGPAFLSEVGTKIIDQSPQQTIPYSDSVITQTAITTTSTSYNINTGTISFVSGINPVDQVSVYYKGRLLRKTGLDIHDSSISFNTTSLSLISLLPEFTINTGTNQIQLNIEQGVVEGMELMIVQRKGQLWTGTESLLTSPVIQADFLRDKESSLPDINYYGGEPTLLDDNYFPLTDDDDTPLQEY
jgi:hypothetical protein